MEENTNSDQNYKGVALAAWIIIGVTCFIALIPAIGLLTWFIAIPVLLATFVLGIIAITKGGTLQGVLILLVSLIVAPAYLLITPMASTFIFAMVFGERQGEYQTERGRIYYFSDGVIAIDTTVTPHRFHIYAIHPKGRKIEKVELIEDGIEISGRGVGEGAKEFFDAAEVAAGFSGPNVPGKVHVIMEKIDKDGELFTSARHIAIDSETIQNLIDRADWNASVRELWEKDKPASKLGTGTSASTEESGVSKE